MKCGLQVTIPKIFKFMVRYADCFSEENWLGMRELKNFLD